MTTKKCTQSGLIITWLHGSAVNNHLSGHNDEASSVDLIKKKWHKAFRRMWEGEEVCRMWLKKELNPHFL